MQHTQHNQVPKVRGAANAGSWYTSNAPQLTADLLGWLARVRPQHPGQQFPPPGCKAIIAPHAGYAYSGETAAWAYKCIDPSTTRRVFILGPSHHWSISNCALTQCETCDTPIGALPVDMDIVSELYAKGGFRLADKLVDEREHSIEMQLPYLRKICEGKSIKVVPIMVGSLSQADELHYGAMLAPYLAEEGNLFIISSDFCHWGAKFDYTYYFPSPDKAMADGWHATRASPPERDFKIWESITKLDHAAMGILGDKNRSAMTAHTDFHNYLRATENTICGRHPIGILWGALARLEQTTGKKASCTWVKYDQSSQVTEVNEYSVSYASAWVKI